VICELLSTVKLVTGVPFKLTVETPDWKPPPSITKVSPTKPDAGVIPLTHTVPPGAGTIVKVVRDVAVPPGVVTVIVPPVTVPLGIITVSVVAALSVITALKRLPAEPANVTDVAVPKSVPCRVTD
jgi:hypothetical protein